MKRMAMFPMLFLTALFLTLAASAAESAIHSVAIDGDAVKVSVTARTDGALWAAVYDESGAMAAAKSENISGAAEARTVALSFDSVPANAYARAFLLDKETLRPLCAPGDTRNAAPVYDSDVYAILYADGALVFQHGDAPQPGREVAETYALDVTKFYGRENGVLTIPWYEARNQIRQVIIADKIKPTHMNYWFSDCENLEEISGLKNLDTSETVSMWCLFQNCSHLTALDLEGFRTDNVRSMGFMFYNCSSLTALDVSGFDTANVSGMPAMFQGCSGLTELDVSNFDTSNVEDMLQLFYGCSGLTALDVSNFHTEKAVYMSAMFFGCSALSELDISVFHTANVTEMEYMFGNCSNLSVIYASEQFVTNQVNETNRVGLFLNCGSLAGGAGTAYDESRTDIEYARIDGGPSNPGYFTAKT